MNEFSWAVAQEGGLEPSAQQAHCGQCLKQVDELVQGESWEGFGRCLVSGSRPMIP